MRLVSEMQNVTGASGQYKVKNSECTELRAASGQGATDASNRLLSDFGPLCSAPDVGKAASGQLRLRVRSSQCLRNGFQNLTITWGPCFSFLSWKPFMSSIFSVKSGPPPFSFPFGNCSCTRIRMSQHRPPNPSTVSTPATQATACLHPPGPPLSYLHATPP